MRNEYGILLDHNRYIPSIMQDDSSYCWRCGKHGSTERHEPFGNALRDKSKALGMWLPLCRECHRTAPDSAHKSRATADAMRQATQQAAMLSYGWTMDEWMRRFYKNYWEGYKE